MGHSSQDTGKPCTRGGGIPRAKAPSLRKDWNKGTQRTRKLSTGVLPCMLGKCEGTLYGVLPWSGNGPQVLSRVR